MLNPAGAGGKRAESSGCRQSGCGVPALGNRKAPELGDAGLKAPPGSEPGSQTGAHPGSQTGAEPGAPALAKREEAAGDSQNRREEKSGPGVLGKREGRAGSRPVSREAALAMEEKDFLDLWEAFRSSGRARSGWVQVELTERFPEFRAWLLKRKKPV